MYSKITCLNSWNDVPSLASVSHSNRSRILITSINFIYCYFSLPWRTLKYKVAQPTLLSPKAPTVWKTTTILHAQKELNWQEEYPFSSSADAVFIRCCWDEWVSLRVDLASFWAPFCIVWEDSALLSGPEEQASFPAARPFTSAFWPWVPGVDLKRRFSYIQHEITYAYIQAVKTD